MTNGQMQQLQELSKCYMREYSDDWFMYAELSSAYADMRFPKWYKAWLRRLTHQYRHQIAAMKRNRGL